MLLILEKTKEEKIAYVTRRLLELKALANSHSDFCRLGPLLDVAYNEAINLRLPVEAGEAPKSEEPLPDDIHLSIESMLRSIDRMEEAIRRPGASAGG